MLACRGTLSREGLKSVNTRFFAREAKKVQIILITFTTEAKQRYGKREFIFPRQLGRG